MHHLFPKLLNIVIGALVIMTHCMLTVIELRIIEIGANLFKVGHWVLQYQEYYLGTNYSTLL